MTTKLKIKKLDPSAYTPKYATAEAACFDLHAIFEKHSPVCIEPGWPFTFRTGLAFEIPAGWCLKIYSRSGHGFNFNTRLANCVGVIDADYIGEVMVKLAMDQGSDSLIVNHGDRIAQAMLERVERVEFEEVEHLHTTARGAGGFGSTGSAA